MLKTPYILAIDGPAGSGKSSIAENICLKLGWKHINTGILYRGIAVIVGLRNPTSTPDTVEMIKCAKIFVKETNWSTLYEKDLFYNGVNISLKLRNPEISNLSSNVAKIEEIRTVLLPVQRQLAAVVNAPGVVVDGRDIGTVVFPEADLKIFLTASVEVRAQRRYQQQFKSTIYDQVKLNDIQEKIKVRDRQDSERSIAPLKKAEGAIEVDTSMLSLEDTIEQIVALIKI